ncbi:MAG: ribbon-helix-helix protein, CopG family [Acidimicrobiia bacterium]|nr:ribbon-helix-helix protein, CopG family [Acidimicrobiia bacterium]
MYGMKRTTIYLPDDLKARLEGVAAREGSSEAEIIRQALESDLEKRDRPPLPIPLFASRGVASDSARRVDEVLDEGFGRA